MLAWALYNSACLNTVCVEINFKRGGIYVHDFHNHSTHSDGSSPIEEIVLNAIKNGLDEVGITDHHRAFFEESPKLECFEEYIDRIKILKLRFKDKIKVKAGIEVNLNYNDPDEEKRIRWELLSKADYVLLEAPDGVGAWYEPTPYLVKFKDIGRIVEKANCKCGLAHTDLFKLAKKYKNCRGIEYGLDYVIGVMKKYNLFWELNTRYDHYYFDDIIDNWNSKDVIMLFNKLKENKIEIVAGSDTHVIEEDFNLKRLKLANMIAAGGVFPGRDDIRKLI
jgi:histidinol phosphatase-like PHP family hydrolase